MRTEIERRIGGEPVRVVVTIGVIEAVAAVDDDMMAALAKLQRGSYRIMRAVLVHGMRAAGRPDPDGWLDGAMERCGVAPFLALAYDALTDAFAKAADAAKKADADQETTAAPAS